MYVYDSNNNMEYRDIMGYNVCTSYIYMYRPLIYLIYVYIDFIYVCTVCIILLYVHITATIKRNIFFGDTMG